MFGLILNVIVLPPFETTGSEAASNGLGAAVSLGGQPISGESTARSTM